VHPSSLTGGQGLRPKHATRAATIVRAAYDLRGEDWPEWTRPPYRPAPPPRVVGRTLPVVTRAMRLASRRWLRRLRGADRRPLRRARRRGAGRPGARRRTARSTRAGPGSDDGPAPPGSDGPHLAAPVATGGKA